jgi:plastocyanin
MARTILLLAATAAAALVAALALALPGNAATPKLVATVGPGESITLRTAAGAPVRNLRAGIYTVTVRDRSTEHNFHISGPGVNKATGIGSTATVTWKVKLLRGKAYRFVCDPHSDDMRGSFRTR